MYSAHPFLQQQFWITTFMHEDDQFGRVWNSAHNPSEFMLVPLFEHLFD